VKVIALAAALAGAFALVAGSHARGPRDTVSQGKNGFSGTISRIEGPLARQMTGVSWRPGCPVHLRDLRLLTLSHWRFDGKVRTGRLIVHADVAREMVDVFRTLYRARFPIRRLVPVDAYGASDFRSIEADNTSAFNCRYVEGTSRWSEHAYGRAIDVNPIENPYVSGGRTSHAASVPYLDRSRRRPGTAYEGGTLVRAFDAIGWGWGGRWSSVKDYQHFSASGR
jgi:D-alanyl-D-alanine carboxypeptidase